MQPLNEIFKVPPTNISHPNDNVVTHRKSDTHIGDWPWRLYYFLNYFSKSSFKHF